MAVFVQRRGATGVEYEVITTVSTTGAMKLYPSLKRITAIRGGCTSYSKNGYSGMVSIIDNTLLNYNSKTQAYQTVEGEVSDSSIVFSLENISYSPQSSVIVINDPNEEPIFELE